MILNHKNLQTNEISDAYPQCCFLPVVAHFIGIAGGLYYLLPYEWKNLHGQLQTVNTACCCGDHGFLVVALVSFPVRAV